MTKKNKVKKITIITILAVLILSLPLFFYVYFMGSIYPNVYVASVNLTGQSLSTAINSLSKINRPDKVTLTFNNQNFEIDTSSINLNYDIQKSAERALLLGRSGNVLFDMRQIVRSLFYKTDYGLDLTFDEKSLDSQIANISNKVTIKPVNPTFQVSQGKLEITPGKPGTEIDLEKLKLDIEKNLSENNTSSVSILVKQSSFDSITFINNAVSQIAKNFDKDPVNAKFIFANNHVQSFLPESDGLKVDTDKLKSEISEALMSSTNTINIPTILIPASVKTSDVNNLGIKELIGSGTSHFAGSIASRIYNVNLAASRVNNTLIAPGGIFSFDETVGDISALNGYQQAYVIQNGQTVLGDGGGVCQVSTTMFRAALASGLPIVERHAHAYQVHYYEEDAPPGMDATIYSPTVDFKFKNDTGNYILIQTQIDLRNLVLTFNLYGTKDGRVANITKPTLWDYKPAPADSYTDDPTLPAGVVKQVDFAAAGVKSQFKYTVTKNGQVINEQTFFSDFQPWQAKFLRGTKI